MTNDHNLPSMMKGKVIKQESKDKAVATRIRNGGFRKGENHHWFGINNPASIDVRCIEKRFKKGNKPHNFGKTYDEIFGNAAEKYKKSLGRNQKGENNPAFGRVWLVNEELKLKTYLKKDSMSIQRLLSLNWKFGNNLEYEMIRENPRKKEISLEEYLGDK